MNTNVRCESTEYTEETESLADVGHRSEAVGDNSELNLEKRNLAGLRLLGGFHALRAEWRGNTRNWIIEI